MKLSDEQKDEVRAIVQEMLSQQTPSVPSAGPNPFKVEPALGQIWMLQEDGELYQLRQWAGEYRLSSLIYADKYWIGSRNTPIEAFGGCRGYFAFVAHSFEEWLKERDK